MFGLKALASVRLAGESPSLAPWPRLLPGGRPLWSRCSSLQTHIPLSLQLCQLIGCSSKSSLGPSPCSLVTCGLPAASLLSTPPLRRPAAEWGHPGGQQGAWPSMTASAHAPSLPRHPLSEALPRTHTLGFSHLVPSVLFRLTASHPLGGSWLFSSHSNSKPQGHRGPRRV